MRKLTQKQLDEILENHKLWLEDRLKGKKANLSQADLRGRNLINADLRDANLRFADLRDADLRFANLRDANLIYANLSDADLRYADLSNTDLRGVVFLGVIGFSVVSTQFDSSRKNNTLNYIVESDIAITGCFQGTLQELKDKVQDTHKDNEVVRKRYEKAIAFIEDMIKDYKENA